MATFKDKMAAHRNKLNSFNLESFGRREPHNVSIDYDLKVISFPYFKAKISYCEDRVAFFEAKRDGLGMAWTIERQAYTVRDGGSTQSRYDFVHGPNSKVESLEGLMEAFAAFQKESMEKGMERVEVQGSSYTYGADVSHALKLLRRQDLLSLTL